MHALRCNGHLLTLLGHDHEQTGTYITEWALLRFQPVDYCLLILPVEKSAFQEQLLVVCSILITLTAPCSVLT